MSERPRAGQHRLTWVLSGLAVLGVAACAPSPRLAPTGSVQRGVASWYGGDFHGRQTASGERYDMHALTAAHPSLPFDTLVEVRNLDNGRSTQVRINDRGPFKKRRIIDLSLAAAQALDLVAAGTAQVELTTLGRMRFAEPRYTVQVGAFQERGRADALAGELCGGYPAVEVRSEGAWHRVQIGRFESRELAESLQQRLARGGVAALIVAIQ